MYDTRPTPTRPWRLPVEGRGWQLLLVVLWLAWLLPGLLGHDPWKPDEAYGFGLVYHILQTGDWVVPTLAGEPFLARPPLYYLTSAAFAKLLSPPFSLPDAARLASGFYMLLTLLCTARASRELLGRGKGGLASLILLGCLGLLLRAHELNAELAALAGPAIAIYGLALCRRRPTPGGLLLGTGIGIGFLAKGLLVPVGLVVVALLLPLQSRDWRRPQYGIALQSAVLALLPWVTLWPYFFYERAPDLFVDWWSGALAALPGFGDPVRPLRPLYYLKLLPWFAWPALPLALWALWRGRDRWLQQPILLPLLTFVVLLVLLALSRDVNQVHALVLLLPLSLLAAEGVSTLRRGAAAALDWFGVMTFGLVAALLWFYWSAPLTGFPPRLAAHLMRLQPGFKPTFEPVLVTLAVAYTLGWLAVLFTFGRGKERPVLRWAAGMALVWGLLMTLWLPWIDAGKSYLPMIASLQNAMPKNYRCIAGSRIGSAQRALLQYHMGLTTLRQDREAAKECDLLLAQGTARTEADVSKRWKKIWEGSRPGDSRERFRLYQRVDEAS